MNLPQTVTVNGNTITYTYDASGQKLKKAFTAGGVTTKTEYISGIQYTNGAIDFVQTEEGRARLSGSVYKYEYDLKDHLGNTRATVTWDGADATQLTPKIVQQNDYYAFGLSIKSLEPTTPSPKNQYLYNGKELQEETGQYDYGARFYDPVIARWTTIDPLAEKMRRWSPYNFDFDNPLRYLDPDGMKPGDLFKSPQGAAKDFGMTYNGKSIKEGQEYGSRIYVVVKDGKTFYTYTNPNTGGNAAVDPSREPKGSKAVADIHSHGKYEAEYDNNNFSSTDKADNKKTGLTGYLTTPDGSLEKYDPKTNKQTTISTDLPSDPKDPDRKNTVSPNQAPPVNKPVPEPVKPTPPKKNKEDNTTT